MSIKYSKINVQSAKDKFSKDITKATNVTEASKLETIAKICAISENIQNESRGLNFSNVLNESFGATTPAQMPNMGAFVNPTAPTGAVGQAFDPNYQRGSDFTTAKLGIAMNVAAHTVALDLVPTIPIDMPQVTYGFMDIIYAGGRLNDATNKISYIAVDGGVIGDTLDYTKLVKGGVVFLGASDGTALTAGIAVQGVYMGKSRINAKVIIRVQAVGELAADGTFVANTTNSVSDVVAAHAGHALVAGSTNVQATVADVLPLSAKAIASEVSALDNHIQAASTVDQVTDSPDSREVAEQGTTSRIGMRFYTKQVAPREYSIEGEATRHQITDLGAYGIDVYSELFKAAQNELTQSINKHISKTLFRLGVTSAAALRVSKGANLNLFVGAGATPNKALSAFDFLASETGEFVDVLGVDRSAAFGNIPNGETNSSAENQLTRQRKIQTKLLAAQALVNNASRRGEGDFAIINSQIKAALADSVTLPTTHANTLGMGTSSLYFLGKIANLDIYVDPNMDWNDTRVCIGRKGNERDSGLKFMPYDLVSSVNTIAEGTMSMKFLVASRYALLPAGFHPETNYLTIALQSDLGGGFV